MGMRRRGWWAAGGLAILVAGSSDEAGAAGPLPILDLAESVVPAGEPVRGTVLGEPGHFYAVAVSEAGEGLSVQGLELDLGPDAVVVATGRLDRTGRGRFTGPVVSGTAPRYVQALTAESASLAGLRAEGGVASWRRLDYPAGVPSHHVRGGRARCAPRGLCTGVPPARRGGSHGS
jgi:hypothetical protein